MEGDLQRRLGQRLRAERKARRMSQERLAELLSVHRTYVGSVERGERNITLQTLERLAAGLGMDPVALLGAEPAPS